MNILVIAAHMDDEVLGAGGVIRRHIQAGDHVTVCVVCKRAYDHAFPSPLVEREKRATRAAAKVLGYRDLRFLDLRDELLDERLLDVIVPLERCVAEVRPSVVYTHHRGDSNQDHRAVFQAAWVACRPIALHRVRRFLCFEVPSSTDMAAPFAENAFQPNFFVDITGELKTKQAAARCYANEMRSFPHPRSIKGLDVLAQKRGMESGFNAAESFVLVRDAWPSS